MSESGFRGVTRILCFLLAVTLVTGCRVATPVVKTDRESLKQENRGETGAQPVVASGEMGKKAGNSLETNKAEREESKDQYRIGPGDILHVSVWNNKELTMDVMVRPDGKISLPLLQDVNAKGLTAVELRDEISERLKEFVIEPIVTITVKEVNYPKFFIMGEIKRPGTFPLREKISILQAISLAGGFTEYASTSNIILIRNTPSGQKRIKINYGKLLKSGAEKNNIYLQPGDTIIIP